MVSQKVIIKNKSGIHARPASILAHAAGKCKSNVKMLAGNKSIEVKSILNLMAASIKCGMEIELQCDGETEQEDLKILVELVENGLSE